MSNATRTCAVNGCDRQGRLRRGVCDMHYQRLMRWGTTEPRTIAVRFWAKVDQSGDCWLWTGSHQPNGYPKFHAAIGGGYAHRASYVLNVGPIPEGVTIDHICNHPSCVRPDHLRLATQQENILRSTGPAAVNARKTHCINGHSLADAYIAKHSVRRQCRQCSTDKGKAYRAKLAS